MTSDSEGRQADSAGWVAVAREAAREAGALLVARQGSVIVRNKGPRDLVTEADVESQRLLRSRLLEAFPDHRFLGEEETPEASGKGTEHRTDGYIWVVDPLDGTMNFVHGMPHFAVSIALLHGHRPQVGVIYQPVGDQMFWAERNGGAWRNGRPLRCSDCRRPAEALLAVSLAACVQRESIEVSQLEVLLETAQGVRRLGSAALNLAYVAAGWLDGYWAWHGNLWDVAAGWLLVEESGGAVLGLMGDPFDVDRPHLVAAGTESLARALIGLLNRGAG